MSQTMKEVIRQQMSHPLKVKYEKNPTTLIPTAKLISKDLRVKVKDVGIIFETKGKGWLIEQIEISNSQIVSTILQQTTSNAWIAFDVVHDKDVTIDKTWVEIPRSHRDMKIMMYPAWFTMAILAAIEVILIKKTLIDKDIIILSKDNWTNILWITIAVIGWFALVFYYAQKLRLHEAYFQSVGYDYVSARNLDFYMTAKRSGKPITLRHTETVSCYRGFYHHPDLPEKRPFKEERIDKESVDAMRYELKLARDGLRQVQEREFDITSEIEVLNEEKRQMQLIQINPGPEEVSAQRIKDMDEIIALKEVQLRDLKKELTEEHKKFEIKVEKLKKEFYKVLQSIYGFDDKKELEKTFEQLFYSAKIADKLRSKVADLQNQLITSRESEGGLYFTLAQQQDTFNQRVAEEAARRTNTTYDYQIISTTEEGEIIPVTTSGAEIPGTVPGKKRFGVGSQLNTETLIPLLIKFSFLTGFVFGFIYLIKYTSDIFAKTNPWLVVVVSIGLIIGVIVVSNILNRILKFKSAADYTIRESV